MSTFRYVGYGVLHAKGIAAVAHATGQSLEHLLGACQAATPVETGTLRASEHVDGPHLGGDSVIGYVRTGGEADEYALYVHEGTSKMAPRKYMEGPLVANKGTYANAIKAAAAGQF